MNPTQRNLGFGWWCLLAFLSLGMVLEALHGFKAGFYLDVVNEARRLQWTLAHTHGTLLALVNVAFALTFRAAAPGVLGRLALPARCLRWAAILMPAGFLLGGAFPMGADPGLGVVLVPIGGVLLFVGVLAAARLVLGAAEAAPASAAEPAGAEPGGSKRGRKA